MTSLFTANGNLTSEIYQPQMVRSRQRYKGVKESSKFNLESNQFYYDIRFLYGFVNELLEQCTSMIESVWNDNDIDGVDFDTTWADVGTINVALRETLNDIINRIEALTIRIAALSSGTGMSGEHNWPSPSNYPHPFNWPG